MAIPYQNGMATPEELGKDAWIRWGKEVSLFQPQTRLQPTDNKALLQGGKLEKRWKREGIVFDSLPILLLQCFRSQPEPARNRSSPLQPLSSFLPRFLFFFFFCLKNIIFSLLATHNIKSNQHVVLYPIIYSGALNKNIQLLVRFDFFSLVISSITN